MEDLLSNHTDSEYDLKTLDALGVDRPSASVSNKLVWHTPRKLQLALALTCLVTLLSFITIEAVTSQFHNAVKTVGHDAAPSIVMAERIKAGLANMDADVANELIAPPGQNKSALDAYEADRKQVTDNLVSAAQNITYGDAERIPISTIEEALGTYEADVAQSRVFHKRGGDPEVLPSYHQATVVMHTVLLPAADALDKANTDMLTNTYASQKAACGFSITFVWLSGLTLLAALVALQIFLFRTMRRMINPSVAMATLMALGFLIFTTASLQSELTQLKTAKEDSFDSVYALWHARAVAYDANAAESRWLLDPAYGSANTRDFFDGIGKLATFGPGESYESLAQNAQQHESDGHSAVSELPTDFHGYLADEIHNTTFPGEMDLAVATLRDLGVYVAIDGQIRQIEKDGKHADAIALCIGNNSGQSDWAYNEFDKALGAIIDLNQQQFDLAIAQADQGLMPFAWFTPFMSIMIAGLVLLGVLPRMREYHF